MIDPFSESKWAPSKSYLYGRSLRNAQRTQKVSFFIRENWSNTLRSAEHFSVILQISSAPPFSLSSMLAATVTAPAHRSDQQSDQLCTKFGFLALGEPMRVSRYSRTYNLAADFETFLAVNASPFPRSASPEPIVSSSPPPESDEPNLQSFFFEKPSFTRDDVG